MKGYPNSYTKSQFLEFLKKNRVSETIIEKYNTLPELINRNGSNYKLNIVATWYDGGTVNYNFELNYYSEDLIEFLFPYQIFPDIEQSIDTLNMQRNKPIVEKVK